MKGVSVAEHQRGIYIGSRFKAKERCKILRDVPFALNLLFITSQ